MFESYTNRAEALTVINQWVLDGSRIEDWGNCHDYDWVILRGADGVREEFRIFLEDPFDE